MLPGIGGSLLGGAFLEQALDEASSELGQPPFVRLQRWWQRVDRTLGPASSVRAVLDVGALPLADICGTHVLHIEPHGRGLVGLLGSRHQASVVLHTTTWDADAEAAWRDTIRAGRSGGVRWGLVYTGPRLRIVDASRTWSRRFIEFDLRVTLADERSTTALWLVLAGAFHTGDSGDMALARLVEGSDRQARSVCGALGEGVLDALDALVTSFDRRGRRHRSQDLDRASFEQAVTVVYRILFLLFAEARALVPTWHRVYRESYTIDALSRRIGERAQSAGLWEALQAIARLAHSGCKAGDLVVTAFNGRLFSPSHTPLGERVHVPDALAQRAVLALTTTPGRDGRRRIAYADLGVEQLGAVYERVLEYEPRRDEGPLALTRTSHERKATGSFYTPRAMTDFIVRRTLHPLVAGRTADRILDLTVVDPAMGSGAFLVSACRYLAAACERALVAQGEWDAAEAPTRRAELRRLVAQRSLYGVDLNPMAVQLARLSLWLTTLTSDRPLTFLDHRLAVGNSLLGASFADLARGAPRQRRRQRVDDGVRSLFDDETAWEIATRVLPERARMANVPDSSPAVVREKERLLLSLTAVGAPLSRWKQAADLWCAAWMWPSPLTTGVYGDVVSALLERGPMLSPHQRREVLDGARATAQGHGFFHWELEFPEVFFDADGRRRADGGFDAVIGNPPWDVLRADAGDREARARVRGEQAEAARFLREAGVYRHQGGGHGNRYQLFVERALQLTRAQGRIGLVLPSGFATDTGSGPLRRAVLEESAVDRIIGFDNRRAIFPIHRDVKFLLLTATAGERTEHVSGAFARSSAEWLDLLPDAVAEDPPDARTICLSRSLLASWDQQHLSIPLLASARDVDIFAHARAVAPPLGDPAGWHVQFARELNATDDKPHFVARVPGDEAAPRDRLTVIEGKHLEPFRVDAAASRTAIPASIAATLVDPARTYRRPRLAYRDVASATNRLTLIAAVLPAGCLSTHTVFCLKSPLSAGRQRCLLALFNSLVANYLVRLQVTTHVTVTLMSRLPVPRPGARAVRELAALARSLERTGIGDIPTYARLNAIVAALYQLTPEQYEHIVSTFPLLDARVRATCLASYGRATETRRHGEEA
jgi:hypothetical protein